MLFKRRGGGPGEHDREEDRREDEEGDGEEEEIGVPDDRREGGYMNGCRGTWWVEALSAVAGTVVKGT